MINVIIEYKGAPAASREQIGKVLSAINSKAFKQLKKDGIVRTVVAQGELVQQDGSEQ